MELGRVAPSLRQAVKSCGLHLWSFGSTPTAALHVCGVEAALRRHVLKTEEEEGKSGSW